MLKISQMFCYGMLFATVAANAANSENIPASTANTTSSEQTAMHPGGWHVGITNGFSIINTQEGKLGALNSAASWSDVKIKNQAYSGGVYLGYDWAITNRWLLGAEVGYQDFARVKTQYNVFTSPNYSMSYQTKLQALNALLTAKYWLNQKLDVFTKLGMMYEQEQREVMCTSGTCTADYALSSPVKATEYHLNPEMQAGLGWQFSAQWNINLAYQHVFNQNISLTTKASGGNNTLDTRNDPFIDSILLGIDYQFNNVPMPSMAVSVARSGWHVGLNNGFSIIETSDLPSSDNNNKNSYSLKNRVYTPGAYFGYDWAIGDRWNLGVEGGFQDFTRTKVTIDNLSVPSQTLYKVDVQALNVLLTAKYWLTRQVDFFTKWGVAAELLHQRSECTAGDCSAAPEGTYQHVVLNPELQGGLGWQFADNWNINLAYQQIVGLNITQSNNPSINSILLGMDYQFTDVDSHHRAATAINPTAGSYIGILNGLSVGTSFYKNNNSSSTPGNSYSLSTESYTGGVYLGYDWLLNSRWTMGVEGGYQDFGRLVAKTTTDSGIEQTKALTQGVNAFLTAKYWLNNQLDLFSKLGFAYQWQTTKNSCGDNCTASINSQGTQYYISPEIESGFGWQLASNWNLNLAYQHFITASNYVVFPSMQKFDSALFEVEYHFNYFPTLTNTVAVTTSGWHVGIENGLSLISTGEQIYTNSTSNNLYSLKNQSYTGGAYLAYDWALNSRWNMGWEMGYQDLGHSKFNYVSAINDYNTSEKVDINAMNLLLTAKYWLNRNFDVFGKFGAAYEFFHAKQECSGDCSYSTAPFNANSRSMILNPEIQAGLGWQFADDWNLNLAYQRIISNSIFLGLTEHSTDQLENPSINSVLLGIDYQFSDDVMGNVFTLPLGGWYVGVNNGLSILTMGDMSSIRNQNDWVVDSKTHSYTTGGYWGYDTSVTNYWDLGIENGYQYLGRSKAYLSSGGFTVNSKTTAQMVDALLTSKYWLSRRFDVLAKLGVAYERVKGQAECSGDCSSSDAEGIINMYQGKQNYFTPEAVVGLGWQLATDWNINLAYQQIGGWNLNAYNRQNPVVDSLLVGVDYQF